MIICLLIGIAVLSTGADPVLIGDLADGGQLVAGFQPADAKRLLDLVDQLQVGRQAGTGLKDEAKHAKAQLNDTWIRSALPLRDGEEILTEIAAPSDHRVLPQAPHSVALALRLSLLLPVGLGIAAGAPHRWANLFHATL